MNTPKQIFVLDTNVLMHDPMALFHFQEHDVYLPMVVLEELDNAKKGHSEVARNARQSSRFIDKLISGATKEQINSGLPLDGEKAGIILQSDIEPGCLFFQTRSISVDLPKSLPGGKPDNAILATILSLQQEHPEKRITLVSKDVNMRIKSAALGLDAQDYLTDQVLDDINLLFTGVRKLPADFWETHGKEMESWQEEGRTFYRVHGPLTSEWSANESLYIDNDQQPFEARVHRVEKDGAIIEMAHDFCQEKHQVFGIHARNREQNFALNLLTNPDIDFISLLGQAGTGKTLLTLAAALQQTLEEKIYNEIIITRVTIPVGEDIGFLPGTEEEKMTPWMGAVMDNLEVLTGKHDSEWERNATKDLLDTRIKIRSLNFMRGRTFLNKFIILDESQNLTAKQMRTLITRAGPGTKVVCLGNNAQIDTPYLTESSSGLTFVVDRFRGWEHSGHITLVRGERSRLADYAAGHL